MKDPLYYNKLIVMYVLHQVTLPMTRVQLFDYILKEKLAEYFELQKSVEELLLSEMIVEESDNSSTYLSLTPNGAEAIELLQEGILKGTRDKVSEDFLEGSFDEEDESTDAGIFKNEDGDITVCLTMGEGTGRDMQLWLRAKDERAGHQIIDNFNKKSQIIYDFLKREL